MIADHDRSTPYIVTEWFEGKTLRQILAEQKTLPVDRAVRITLEICDALGYLHNRGIVHRDLKPENILVGAGDHIKLINFRAASKTGAARITFTNLSQIVGSSSLHLSRGIDREAGRCSQRYLFARSHSV